MGQPVSPYQAGFHMPAEWEPHEATWMGWPHNASDWPGKLAAVRWAFGEIVRKLAEGERVRILVNDLTHEDRARSLLSRAGANLSRIDCFQIPTDRSWTRDCGPIFVTRRHQAAEVAIARFTFTAWSRYANWQQDNQVPVKVARRLRCRIFPVTHNGRKVTLEGGSLDVNGAGTGLTTEECLLDPEIQVRNPGFSRETCEQVLRDSLGITHLVWLHKGIAGDDTHGHVDDVCRFVNPTTVVLCQEPNGRDDNHRVLAENRDRLAQATLENGASIEVVPLPMPAPLYCHGQRLPASYANFYIGNAAVLVPTFNDPNDRLALGILSELFPDRPVIGIHAVDLLWGLGTVHCLTQQQPALPVA
ncbi:MAG: agmatine deiminase family protein [Nitrospira sp.]|nr:agmatine deiminase family protein [Nitrospira sp.]